MIHVWGDVLADLSDPTSKYGPQVPILQVKKLTVARSRVIVIEDINFSISEGEFVGLVGPNGSGKTTLLLTILGLLKPVPLMGGSIQFYGKGDASQKDIR